MGINVCKNKIWSELVVLKKNDLVLSIDTSPEMVLFLDINDITIITHHQLPTTI